ncbi:serpin B4-like [Pimephales promelas]|uniref:serpin B4-like n=1 Tax=Pimephales promelas TaxID=90988 RepID=UPI001955CE6D|nr:serpin B4-like [Pimephales promelas]
MEAIEPVVLAHSKFSIDLLKELCKGNTENVLFSPLSISSALGLVSLGAGYKSETADQIYKTLHFGEMKIMYHDLYEEIYKEGKSLNLANRMFGERTLNFKDDFLDMCEEWCFGSLRNADFKTNPEAAREQINNWVEKMTNNQITNLLDQGDVSNNTSLVLISAVHFMNKWVKPFTKCVPAIKDKGEGWPMMSQMNKFPLGNIPHRQHSLPSIAQILEIPYANKHLSMIIILPNQSDGLQQLVDLITYENLQEWTEPDNMIRTEVDVKIPLFKLQEKYDMEKVLKTLGITELFGDKCDLSGMTSEKVKVSKVVHKSSVEVNEESTEVAGGTDVVVQSRLLRKNDAESFVADRPFLFFIRHNPTKSIIFWSRFISP